MSRGKIDVMMFVGLLLITSLAAGAAAIPQEVIQGRTPVIQLGVTGVTTTRFYVNAPFCRLCGKADEHRFVSRQITIFDDHTLQSTDAFNELETPGAFAQTVSGKGPAESFARLAADIADADFPEQADGCSVILTHPGQILYENLIFDSLATLDHDYILVWHGPGRANRVLHLYANESDCPTEIRKVVIDILSYEQEVIGAVPAVQASAGAVP